MRTSSRTTYRRYRLAIPSSEVMIVSRPETGAPLRDRHVAGIEVLATATVRDVMSAPIVTCRTEDAIADVARTMSAAGIHCVVVVGDEGPDGEPGRPWRILSDADLVAAAPFDVGTTLAGWIAGTPIRTVDVGEPLQHAALLMAQEKAAHLIAVSDGRPVGIVSGADVVRSLARRPSPA
jgi:CBS domain-containing protein